MISAKSWARILMPQKRSRRKELIYVKSVEAECIYVGVMRKFIHSDLPPLELSLSLDRALKKVRRRSGPQKSSFEWSSKYLLVVHRTGGEGNILQPPGPVVSAVTVHKTFGLTDLMCTYSTRTRRLFGGSGHRTQAFRSGVRCSNP
ncbi:hypothetical protein TNCV_3151311 [Trichonephila clavipes]|nr:hypothetical protein TNCV_3151311 [Trichonephila clavipes]